MKQTNLNKIEFELAIQSKEPDLPKGVDHSELNFSFDLLKIFDKMVKILFISNLYQRRCC